MNKLFDTVIVRHGAEIGVKSSLTRTRYDKLLIKNIKAKLKAENLKINRIDRRFGRIYIKTDTPFEVANSIAKIFGVSSTSPAASCKASLDEIADMAVMLAKEKGDKPLKFAVKCRRVGQHAFTSMDVCRRVGAKILEEMGGRGWRVDLENPELTINIEIRDEDAFLYFDIIRGVGGLPLGSQGPVLCLISSGIDSPVAAWLSMRRGCTITLLHLNIQPYSGEETIKKVVELTKVLAKWSPAFKVKLLMAPFGEVLKNIIEKCPSKLTCVLCKRMMLRIAEKIALNRRLMGIVTGDSIGEQASQTLRNMAVISEAVRKIPIYRPLTGFDKPETEKLAREIGTYEISSRPDEGCKAAPSRPTVAAKIDEVIEAEKQLDIESLIDSSVNRLVELEV